MSQRKEGTFVSLWFLGFCTKYPSEGIKLMYVRGEEREKKRGMGKG